MRQLDLTITAQSPLAIGRQKPGTSVSEVEDYIPGSVIRGAIANQILRQSGQQNTDLSEAGDDFQALFLGDRPAIFRNAYPAIAKVSEKKNEIREGDIKLLPATAVSSKVNPGFLTADKDGVFDTLIDEFWANHYNHPYDPTSLQALENKTDARVEPYSSFYSHNNGNYYRHSASSRLLTRVGINRRRATAEEQILYSIAVLNESFPKNPKDDVLEWEPFVYQASIIVFDGSQEDTLTKALRDYIERNQTHFRLGGSVSRGLGKVTIRARNGGIPTDLVERIESFNQSLKARWKYWKVLGELEDPTENRIYFTLDLQSDAILTENWQRTTVISARMLQQFAQVTTSLPQLHTAYSSYDYRSGWNAAWGLMKDVELVTNRGAVYLFSIDQSEANNWYKALAELEAKGVGDRTAEGFGQIKVCDEFHLVFREEPV